MQIDGAYRAKNSELSGVFDGMLGSSGLTSRRWRQSGSQWCFPNLFGRDLRQHASCGQRFRAWLSTPLRSFRNWNTLRKVDLPLGIIQSKLEHAAKAKSNARESLLLITADAASLELEAVGKLEANKLPEHVRACIKVRLIAIGKALTMHRNCGIPKVEGALVKMWAVGASHGVILDPESGTMV